MKKLVNYAKIVCLITLWCISSVTLVHSFDVPNIAGVVGGPELPPELKRLITDVLRPSFQAAGYFPGLLQRSEFIEKIIPGQHFRGEDVLLHIDKMLKGLNGPDRQENLKVLEAICKFYIEFFKEYIHRKSFGGFLSPKTESAEKSRALILHNVHACYMFSEHGQKKIIKIEPVTKSGIQGVDEADNFMERFPLRLRLTRLIVNIFMLNREERGIALQEDIYRRRKKLYNLLENFHDEVSEILTSFLQRGVVQAKPVLQSLPEFMILLQEHALNISLWNMLVRYGQEQTKRIALTTVSVLGVAAALMFTWRKLMPKTTVEELADKANATWPEVQAFIKESRLTLSELSIVTKALKEFINAMKTKVEADPNTTVESVVGTATTKAIETAIRLLATDEIIKSSQERSNLLHTIVNTVVGYAETSGRVEAAAELLNARLREDKKNSAKKKLNEIFALLNSELRKNMNPGTFWKGLQCVTGVARLVSLISGIPGPTFDDSKKAAMKSEIERLNRELDEQPLAAIEAYEKDLEKLRDELAKQVATKES